MEVITRIRFITVVLWFLITASVGSAAPSVFIVVIDGARYTESFGSKDKYLPNIWRELRPIGTIYTNFRNDGPTITCPGHSALLTGMWENLKNDGSERPMNPTVFERFRKQYSVPESLCYVVSGKPKLEMLTYSRSPGLGAAYKASFAAGRDGDDASTWIALQEIMDTKHPRIVIVNFPDVDLRGHARSWKGYLNALRRVDSIVMRLWKKIQSDPVYRNQTTLLVTNDHGRHDAKHGGFQNHGDDCEGCRHIMLLAIGPQFAKNAVVREKHSQADVAATVSEILDLASSQTAGRSLLHRAE